jgi:hypothetical protein
MLIATGIDPDDVKGPTFRSHLEISLAVASDIDEWDRACVRDRLQDAAGQPRLERSAQRMVRESRYRLAPCQERILLTALGRGWVLVVRRCRRLWVLILRVLVLRVLILRVLVLRVLIL